MKTFKEQLANFRAGNTNLGVGAKRSENAVSNSFTMWLLFLPSGPNTIQVPLRAVNWYWEGSATNGPSGWVIESGTVSHSIDPASYPTEQYPYWTDNITNRPPFHP